MPFETAADPLAFYSALRPAQLCDLVKRVVCIRSRSVRANTDHQFWIDPVSILGMHFLGSGIHEEQMPKLIETVLRPSDVFVDIGANEGYFSVIVASKVPNGVVHCIEPQSRLQEILRTNVQLNGSTMAVRPTAISDRDGSLALFLRPSSNTGASSMFRHWKLGSRVERVPSTTLDSADQGRLRGS